MNLFTNQIFSIEIYLTGVDIFLSRRPIGREKKMGTPNKTACPMETQLEKLLFVLYYLNSTFILSVLSSEVFTMRFL